GLVVAPQDHGGVLVEADVRAVRPPALLGGAHDDRLDDVTLLDVPAGDRVLDGGDDDVADAGVATAGTAEHTDAEDLLRTRVVGDLQSRLLLDHVLQLLSSCRFSRRASLAERMWVAWPGRAAPPGRLLGLLEDLHEPPALGRRQRAGLHDEDQV